jgi:hypothetical protein
MTAGTANSSSLLEVQLKQFVFEKYFCNERIQYQALLLGKA